MSARENTINYIELPMTDIAATKSFYGSVFGWTFQDWGETYISFHGAGIDGGFDAITPTNEPRSGAVIILYSDQLEAKRDQVTAAGGKIIQDIFTFPGGRRFHFQDPNGNELAIWTEQDEA